MSARKPLGVAELKECKQIYRQLIIVCTHNHAYELVSEGFQVVGWVPEEGKAAAINKAARQARASHILWLEQGERLLEIPNSNKSTYHRARVVNDESEHRIHNWQVRLFPNAFPGEAPCQGFDIPEIYTTSIRSG